jgi:hypothetical protein
MKKIYYILTILLCIYIQTANAQMGVNSTGAVPNAAAMLDVRSSDKGFLMPRMTTTQRDAMPAIADGLMIYNTSKAEIEVYRGLAGWKIASRMGVPFIVSGSDVGGVVQGTNTGSGFGVSGIGGTGSGVVGVSTSGFGVYGQGGSTGVYGTTTDFAGVGVYGETNTNRGVWGRGLTTGDGVYGDATSGNGVRGDATSGNGVHGIATTGIGVRGNGNQGVFGEGIATGVFGNTTEGTGVFGRSDTFRGVWGRGITTGDGVYGDAISGKGVHGVTSGTGIGVYGSATAGGIAVYGQSNSGDAGYFSSVSGKGVYATSSSGNAIVADNTSASVPVAQLVNLSGGTALELIASTAVKITGAIKVAGGVSVQPAFKIVSSAGNITLNQLTIPNTTLANNANDIVMVTHNYGSGGPYLNKAYGVFWTGSSWTIYLEDSTAMPVGVTFNVLVIKQ